MKVFSINNKFNLDDFWASITPDMMSVISRNPVAYENLHLFIEHMQDTENNLYKNNYEAFVTTMEEEERLNLILKYTYGCSRKTKECIEPNSKEIAVADTTDDSDEYGSTSHCVSSQVFQCSDMAYYDQALDVDALPQIVAEFEDIRDMIRNESGVDIFPLILFAGEARFGTSSMIQQATETLRGIIKEYNISDLMREALSVNGFIDFISAKVSVEMA